MELVNQLQAKKAKGRGPTAKIAKTKKIADEANGSHRIKIVATKQKLKLLL